MRGILLDDSRIYRSQTFDLVDISSPFLEKWLTHPKFGDLLLAASTEIPSFRPEHLRELANRRTGASEISAELKAMRNLLLESGRSESEVDTLIAEAAKRGSGDMWQSYDSELDKLRSLAGGIDWAQQRKSIEFVFVRHDRNVAPITLDDIKLGSSESQLAGIQAAENAASAIGLTGLRLVQALPILLVGYGYSRYFSSPGDVASAISSADKSFVDLNPYKTQGKIPIYIARNTTEGICYELDPWRVAAFLEVNKVRECPREVVISESALRAWLLGVSQRFAEADEAHLLLKPYEVQSGASVDEASALLFGLLHTMSHVLQATAHKYVGLDRDSLAEYLFPAHRSGMIYASAQVQFTLGGIDSIFRSNLAQWLHSILEFAGSCSFDPVCSHGGGACPACLFAKFGCSYFNRSLSRAYLQGGVVNGLERPLTGYWSAPVVKRAEAMKHGRG